MFCVFSRNPAKNFIARTLLAALVAGAGIAVSIADAAAQTYEACGEPVQICQGPGCANPPNTNETVSVPDLKVGDTIRFNVTRDSGDTVDTQCRLQFDEAGGSIDLDPESVETSPLAPGDSDTSTVVFTATQSGTGRVNIGPPTRGVDCPRGSTKTQFSITPLCKIAPITKKLTLVKSTTTASFQAEGETISYEYLVTNEGNVTLTDLAVADDKATVSCPVTALAPGASTTCTASYNVTAGDITAGAVKNTASATAKYIDETVTSNEDMVTVPYKPIAGAAISIDKTADKTSYTTVGEIITYSYLVANTGDQPLSEVTVTDDKLGAICGPLNLAPGASTTCETTYGVTEGDIAAGAITNVATATGKPDEGETVSDTDELTILFDKQDHEDETKRVIKNFINRRVDLLASNEPDRARMLRRFRRDPQPTGSLKDGPMHVRGSITGQGNGRFAFATSLSQARAHAQAPSGANLKAAQKLGLGALASHAAPARPHAFDFWVEGHYQRWSDSVARNDRVGNFGILYVGADYLVKPWLLIGALVQYDTMSDRSKTDGTRVSGRGWMAGPYVGIKFSDHLMFDARAAWGTSDNSVTPFGTYSDSFDTERWLAKATLTGNWQRGRLRFSPSVGVIYVSEEQKAYTDTLGVRISSQTSSIGRVIFGPEFGYATHMSDGTLVEPQLSVKGMWDFEKSAAQTVQGLHVADDDFRVKIEAGVMVKAPSGFGLRATLSHDGVLSDDFSAWGGQLWVNVPLN